MPLTKPTLYATHKCQHYADTDEASFCSHLLDASRYMDVIEVVKSSDLRMDIDGKVLGGEYRFTAEAFIRFANRLAIGLAAVARDIAGETAHHTQYRNAHSFDDAATIYNTVLARRFSSRVDGVQLVLNTRDKVIEGVVGSKYKRIDNYSVYERAIEAMPPASRRRFIGAWVTGSRMMCRYALKDVLFDIGTAAKPDRYYAGYHIGNSEDGYSSVRAGAVLFREFTGGMAFSEAFVNRQRVKHTGKHFEKRIGMLLSESNRKVENLSWVEKRMRALQEFRLDFGDKRDEMSKRREALSASLQKEQVPKYVADMAITFAYNCGSRMPASHSRMASAIEIASRTAYDLVDGLMSAATTLYPGDRERTEQVAFELIADLSPLRKGAERGGQKVERESHPNG